MKFLLSLFLFAFEIFVISSEMEPSEMESSLDSHHKCLDTDNHKREPGPESDLFSECSPWKNYSCCTSDTTLKVNSLSMYNFTFDHCPDKNLSDECRKYFIQDSCFYECSPNIGPWIVTIGDSKYRRERFYGVPLCQSECNKWFEACKEDYTCTDNWSQNVHLINENGCKEPCSTFNQIFETAENFCEKVWDGSWKVVNDSEPCMKIWFDASEGNPNDKIAQLKYADLARMSSSSTTGLQALASLIYLLLLFNIS